MTNKEILQASILDILFENRNKDYGAYKLRKNYGQRLLLSMGISFSLVLLLLWMIPAKKQEPPRYVNSVTYIEIPTYRPQEVKPPEPPAEPQQPRSPKKMVETPHIDAPIKIVPNEIKNIHVIPSVKEIETQPSTLTNVTGNPNGVVNNSNQKSSGNNNSSVHSDNGTFVPQQSDAQFPGGKEAFANFLRKYLVIPYELEAGDKKTVLVRFKVDVDGNISQAEILQSGGEQYDKEVIRVLKKMPKWIPAEQNGVKVATYFTQPVIFIGIEQ